jgi:hypothetical protein
VVYSSRQNTAGFSNIGDHSDKSKFLGNEQHEDDRSYRPLIENKTTEYSESEG